jgi:hypothetical protein
MFGRPRGAALTSMAAVFMLAVSPASGQMAVSSGGDTFWLAAGVGVGSEDFGASLNASYQFGANLISLRSAATAGLFDDGFHDVALLYGRATRPGGERYQLGAALGVAVVDGCRSDGALGGCRDFSAVIGLPLELQAFWRPGRLVGLGFYSFANLNQARSFAGLTLGLQLGRLR